jgi:hypothetical protein
MDINEIKDWLIPVSTFITLVSISVGVWLSLKEYRLKLQTEARLSHSTQAETDIRLLTLFTQIMNIAHARSGTIASEKAIEKMFDKGILTQDDFKDMNALHKKIQTVSVFSLTVGLAAQVAAIAAIATLAKRHDVLREPAIAGLQSLSDQFNPSPLGVITQKYLDELQGRTIGDSEQ